MIVLQIVSLIFWLWILPIWLGIIPAKLIEEDTKFLGLPLVCGYILEWFIFQMLAVPIILFQQKIHFFDFTFLVWVYIVVLMLLAAGAIFYIKRNSEFISFKRPRDSFVWGKTGKVFFALFWISFIVQILGVLFFAFADGDDAYYVAVATIAEKSDTMYMIPAYTGGTGEMDYRHSLAPMPIWIAFISRVTGVHVATIAHVAVPVAMLLVAYGLYGCIGQVLCKDKRDMMPLFLFLVSLLVLFGNYSMKTTETFLLTRTAQGKAILGNVIFPFAILLLLLLIGRIVQKEDSKVMQWAMLIMLSGAACLCSGLGGVLIIVMYGVVGFYTGLCYKRWNILSRLVSCCLPALICVALYLVVQKL